MSSDTGAESVSATGTYVYGIVPADVETNPDAAGVGDPPGQVTIVRHNDIAALVSEIETDHPLGTPDDLQAHARLLDGSAGVVPVLPLRFGSVMTDSDAVIDDLLSPHHDEFRAALDELEGQAQYVVKARYEETAMLREILSESADADRLREEIRDKPEDATRDARIALGELIGRALDAKRDTDTGTVLEAIEPLAHAVNVRPPSHDLDSVHVALLLDVAAQDDLEKALTGIAGDWSDRAEIRVLGPMAAYDFVLKAEPEPEN
ncbi:GvpL/GvpF family gas vesicle protein [Rhodococcus maanshanensis]|uniref:Gas vesicle synthesis protein GvpL/GvpF n=1 Tax=Rhodococcus maanshanensis TaxID=183556 RepID=A0A1H7LSS8_9NOCA|nr:GvpL/GvpF family gas vesicle protein [Rhodococcus maanshanensis]SEL01407.1 Gas vesicle synthesis protein GvpL/GvpF [Rhodococcus maanshanensis]